MPYDNTLKILDLRRKMMNFKIIALKDAFEKKALAIVDGDIGDASRALSKVSDAKGTMLVEAMPESSIAQRLLELGEFVEDATGPLVNPLVEFKDEQAMFQIQDFIYHVMRLASLEKLQKVLLHFVHTYVSLREVATTNAEVVLNATLKDGDVLIDESKPLVVLQVNPLTDSILTQHARNEIIQDREISSITIGDKTTRINQTARYFIEFRKYSMLRDIIYAVFFTLSENKRLEDVQAALGVQLRLILDADGSLITVAELLADPEKRAELAELQRKMAEEAAMREEAASRMTPEARAWLEAHADELAEFDEADEQIENGDDGKSVQFEEVDADDDEVGEEDEDAAAHREEPIEFED